MFLQTLGITVKRVGTVLKKKHENFSIKHSGQPRNKISNDVHDLILEHLHCLPTVPVHYRRAESNKRYFEDNITPGILYKLFKDLMKNTSKRKVENPHNDQISIETDYWETAKLEKGSSVITISDTYNIGDGKQVDTKMKPTITIRTPRKRPKEILERCQEMELQHLYSDKISVPTELKKGITSLCDSYQIPDRYYSFFRSINIIQ